MDRRRDELQLIWVLPVWGKQKMDTYRGAAAFHPGKFSAQPIGC
jgi:hypothetical protein